MLGPALFYNILPKPIYRHYCILVCALRILHQRSISRDDLRKAHSLILAFVRDYEILYYQQRTARIHFVRQSIHSLTHLAREILMFGPPGLYSQWTMERTIGNLGEEIRQPSNPYANLSQRAVRRGQLNAVTALMPQLARPAAKTGTSVQASYNLYGGYTLRAARDSAPSEIAPAHTAAIEAYLSKLTGQLYSGEYKRVTRWARLALPNGHIARSAWKESRKAHGSGLRIARNVKVRRTMIIYFVAYIHSTGCSSRV